MSPPSSFSFLLTSSFVDTDDRLNPSYSSELIVKSMYFLTCSHQYGAPYISCSYGMALATVPLRLGDHPCLVHRFVITRASICAPNFAKTVSDFQSLPISLYNALFGSWKFHSKHMFHLFHDLSLKPMYLKRF